MIETGLTFNRRYAGPEWEVVVRARSGDFAGALTFYTSAEDLDAWGAQLVAFGASVRDEALFELGSREGGWSYHLLLRAYVHDALGHAAVEFAANNFEPPPHSSSVHLFIPCDVAGINELGLQLRSWSRDGEDPLVWAPRVS